jgi:ADP-heptose:LPS heptosyltransferase
VQKRSRNEKHEFCYNLDLLEGVVSEIDYTPYHFCLSESQLATGRAKIAALGLQRPVIIHPGHGGSAYNIDTTRYAELAQNLLARQLPVLISLGPGEESLKRHFAPAQTGKLAFLENVPDLAELALIYSACQAFVGGSTGPLHLAASLKLPTVAFFPPVAAMTPNRWSPVGNHSLVLKPDLENCVGRCKTCLNRGCMQTIELSPAIEWLSQECQT